MDVFLRQYWTDYRLKHNLSSPLIPLMGQKMPSDFVWIPDTVFANAIKSSKHFVTVTNEKLEISPQGNVFIGSRCVY